MAEDITNKGDTDIDWTIFDKPTDDAREKDRADSINQSYKEAVTANRLREGQTEAESDSKDG